MQIHLKNISLIRNASITLNGLTVIAGENDTGKSTVGKLLFAIIQAFSGIKAFGIIQLLIHASVLDHKSLLIIDEPETHLHPAWQVEYARLMVALAKRGIPVLLTSHSPYVIQALKVAGEKQGLPINYYLAERDAEGFATIHDVTEDLNRIFVKLSAPMQALVLKSCEDIDGYYALLAGGRAS